MASRIYRVKNILFTLHEYINHFLYYNNPEESSHTLQNCYSYLNILLHTMTHDLLWNIPYYIFYYYSRKLKTFLIQNIAIYEINREVFGNMESFTNPFSSLLPWFATPISRIVLLERTIYRPLWIDLVSRDTSVDRVSQTDPESWQTVTLSLAWFTITIDRYGRLSILAIRILVLLLCRWKYTGYFGKI